MATRTSSIIVTHLTTPALYVDKFIVEVYSDAGLTTKVGAGTCEVAWDTVNRIWTQKTSIIFGGLTLGTTYYLRGGVVAPLSGLVTWTTSYSVVAGSSTAPAATYAGTFTATTSGVSFVVTPTVSNDGLGAGATTGIDRYEWIWTLDGTTPASTANPYGSGHIVGTAFQFFTGGQPGTSFTAFVRAVNMNQVAQAWTSLGTYTVSSAWNGTTTGTIGNGTLLGTGGNAVYGSGGMTGVGRTPTNYGFEAGNHIGIWQAGAAFIANDTQTSGVSAYYASGQTAAGNVDIYRAGTRRLTVNSSGTGIDTTPTGTPNLMVAGTGNIQAISSTYPQYIMTNTTTGGGHGIWYQDVSGQTRLQQNDTDTLYATSGQIGINMTPVSTYGLSSYGTTQLMQYSGDVNFCLYDTSSFNHSYGLKSGSGLLSMANFSAGSAAVNLDNSGNFGIGCTPSAPLMMNGVAVVQYASGVPNMVANVNQSTNFIGQGNIITQDLPAWSMATSGTVSGSMSITLTVTGKTMYRGDGSSYTISTQTFTWSSLPSSTPYVFYPYLRTSDNSIHFASANTPSPSSTNVDPGTTPLTSAAIAAALNQMQDGRFALTNGHIGVTTNNVGGGGGGSTGGGTPVCPEQNVPVTIKGRGMVKVITAEVGEYIKGTDLLTGKTVWRKIKAKRLGKVSEWRKYKGFLITPNHPIWYKKAWTAPKDIPSAKTDYTESIAVSLTLEATDYDNMNFWLGDEEVLMHNALISQC